MYHLCHYCNCEIREHPSRCAVRYGLVCAPGIPGPLTPGVALSNRAPVTLNSPLAVGGPETWVVSLAANGVDRHLAAIFARIARDVDLQWTEGRWVVIPTTGVPKVASIAGKPVFRSARTEAFYRLALRDSADGTISGTLVPTGVQIQWRLE